MNQRLMIYRKIADARSDDELDQVLGELRDRYGPCPKPSSIWSSTAGSASWPTALGIESIDREAQTVVIKIQAGWRQAERLNVERLLKVVAARADTTLVPPGDDQAGLAAPVAPKPQAEAGAVQAPLGTKAKARQSTGASWWTARATAGEVTSGFTKEEILKPPKEDPECPGRRLHAGAWFVGRTGRNTIGRR